MLAISKVKFYWRDMVPLVSNSNVFPICAIWQRFQHFNPKAVFILVCNALDPKEEKLYRSQKVFLFYSILHLKQISSSSNRLFGWWWVSICIFMLFIGTSSLGYQGYISCLGYHGVKILIQWQTEQGFQGSIAKHELSFAPWNQLPCIPISIQ